MTAERQEFDSLRLNRYIHLMQSIFKGFWILVFSLLSLSLPRQAQAGDLSHLSKEQLFEISRQLHRTTVRLAVDELLRSPQQPSIEYIRGIDQGPRKSQWPLHIRSAVDFGGAGTLFILASGGMAIHGMNQNFSLGAAAGGVISGGAVFLLYRGLQASVGEEKLASNVESNELKIFSLLPAALAGQVAYKSLTQAQIGSKAGIFLMTGAASGLTRLGSEGTYSFWSDENKKSEKRVGALDLNQQGTWSQVATEEARNLSFLLRQSDPEKIAGIQSWLEEELNEGTTDNLFRALEKQTDSSGRPLADPHRIALLRDLTDELSDSIQRLDWVQIPSLEEQIRASRQILTEQIKELKDRPDFEEQYQEALQSQKKVELLF